MRQELMLLGKIFIQLTQSYLGAVSAQLSHHEIDRHFYLLYWIAKSESPQTQKELAEAIQQDKSSMVRIIDFLVDKGFVKRMQNRADRRESLIVLTEKAEQIVPEIIRAFDVVETEAIKNLDPDELNHLRNGMDRVLENLRCLPSTEVKVGLKRSSSKKFENDVL